MKILDNLNDYDEKKMWMNKWRYEQIENIKPKYKTIEPMLKNGGTKNIRFSKEIMSLNKKFQPHCMDVWFKQFNPDWELVKVVPNVLTPFESNNDFQLYEQMVLVPQLIGRREQWKSDNLLEQDRVYHYLHETEKGKGSYRVDKFKGLGGKKERLLEIQLEEESLKHGKEKETFIEYLKLRSEYFDKDNEFDVIRSEVLKNPNDDVVDAETLRLYMLANNTRQFLYSDKSVEEKHNMENFVRPLLYANFSAKMLEEFKPQKPQKDMTENEKKYFEYMNKLGAFWHDRLKKEANEKLPNFVEIITGEVKAPKCYGQQEHDPRRIPQFYYFKSLYEMLSGKAKAKWDKVMEQEEKEVIRGRTFKIPALKETIRTFEAKFMALKTISFKSSGIVM